MRRHRAAPYDDCVATLHRSPVGVLAASLLTLCSQATWAQTSVAAPAAAAAPDGKAATATAVTTPPVAPESLTPAESPAAPTPLPAAPSLPANFVRLQIVADQPIDLWAKEAGEEPRSVFTGQQDVWLSLPIAHVYTVSGSQIPRQTFRLRALPNLRVDVSVGSKGGQVGGGVLIALGGLGVVTGAVALLIGVGNAGLISFLGGGRMDALTPYWTVGAVGLGVGASLVGGGVLLLVRSRTRVRQSSAANTN